MSHKFHIKASLALCGALAATGLAAAFASATADSKSTMVFILAGQSNMVGQGLDPLPDQFRQRPLNVVFINKIGNPFDGWEPVRCTGPEVGFAAAMSKAFPNRKIGILKYAIGATSLAKNWDPDWTKEKNEPKGSPAFGPLYTNLIQYARATQKKPGQFVAGVVWLQGESDGKNKDDAEKYGMNLTNFIGRIRGDLQSPDLPFVYAIFDPPPQQLKVQPFLNIVAHRQAAFALTRTQGVSMEKIGHRADYVHFDAKGLLEAGQRFAEAMQNLLGAGADAGQENGQGRRSE